MSSPPLSDARIREAWKADRSYLLAVAAGMLHRADAAEDVVQEAFARLTTTSIEEIDDVRGWLVVVVRRLCLDRLGSADARRTMATPTIPEPTPAGIDPADRVTLDDEVRRALAIALDHLSPGERTSFILHDVFGFPFDAIAELVGRTPASCRQLARRARLALRSGPVGRDEPAEATADAQEVTDLAERFIAVCDGGDLRQLIELLDPEIVGLANVIGLPALPPVQGVDAVAQRVLSFFGPNAGVVLETFSLEGRSAVVARRDGQVVAVVRLDEREGRIVHLQAIARPFW